MKALATVLVLTMCAAPARANKSKTPSEQTIEVDDPGASRKRVAVGLTIGGSALMVAAFSVTLVMKSRYDRCVEDGQLRMGADASECPYQDPIEATDYANRQQSIAKWAGTSLFLAGTAALGTALYLRWTAPAKRRVVRVGVAPSVSATGVGFSISGGF